MTKFAPVAPIHIYEAMLETQNRPLLGSYYLLLAHDVLANAKRYEKVFSDPLLKDATIIMDNSVIELGNSVDAKTLIEAAEIVKADCLAMPDVLCDGVETIAAAEKFINDFTGSQCSIPTKLMYIPQGKDLRDYVNCALQGIYAHWPIEWIGIARNTTGRIVPTREMLVTYLKHIYPKAKLHLLGFSVDTLDDIACTINCRHMIEGIDSAVPLRMQEDIRQVQSFIDPGPRGDWWETCEFTDHMFHQILEARHMLEV